MFRNLRMRRLVVSHLAAVCALASGLGFAGQPVPGLLAVEAIEEALPFYHETGGHRWFRFGESRGRYELPPMEVLLSRHRYWAQDWHLDVVVTLDADEPAGELRVRLTGAQGEELARFAIAPLPGPQFVFYPEIPPALADGGSGQIEVAWVEGGRTVAEHRQAFRVEVFDEPVERAGRIRLRTANGAGATGRGLPATVGVPFPRGALADAAHLRLVDSAGREIPMQVKETGRWSKFGSVKWVLCDFLLDLDGGPADAYLEYGPGARRAERAHIAVTASDGFPVVEAGRLRFDGGLWFDVAGDGNHVKVLDERGLSGAFVEHEDGRVFRPPVADRYEIEEIGPEKVVLQREGWYREEGGEEFCQYVIRYVIHRDSPLVRIFHTWILTGDGNRDRIRNMGWEFALPEDFERRGFLTAFGEEAAWEDADYLLQWDYEHFDLVSGAQTDARAGARAPGVAAAQGNGASLYFGTKDFWQNYPSEVEFADGSLWFHNWPRHNRPAGHTFDKELISDRGEPAASSSAARYAHEHPDTLTRSEWLLNALQQRHAHEGEVLNFRLPEAFGKPPIWDSRASVWPEGEVEGVNAQGVSRTEEMWLYLTPAEGDREEAGRVLEGLNDETLRPTAPQWVAQSGAFHEIHHQDWENYPEEERIFELLALAPTLWREALGAYGMWLYGDLFAWSGLALESKQPSLYRALRKGHHGWPYSWVPFARSGDSRLLKAVEASTRQMIDVNYCHYVSEELSAHPLLSRPIGDQVVARQPGIWRYGPVPWAGNPHGGTVPEARYMTADIDHLIHAWHLTGYHRAKDNLLAWGEQSKSPRQVGRAPGDYRIGPRDTVVTLKSWMETYEATFDPWYLVAAHILGKGHREGGVGGNHVYNTGNREFMRFTGCPEFEAFYVALAEHWGDPRTAGGSWGPLGVPVAQDQAFVWLLTGDEYRLARTAHFVDWVTQAVYDAEEPEHVRGQYTYGHGTVIGTSFILRHFPAALGTLARADSRPEAIGNRFQLRPEQGAPLPEIVMRKEGGEALELELARRAVGTGEGRSDYELTGPHAQRALAGEWDASQSKRLETPADAPAGDYRLRMEDTVMDVPLTDFGTREVMVVAPGDRMPRTYREGRFWFLVPEGVEEFYVDVGFPHSQGRISLWGPDGELVWNHNYHGASHTGGRTVRAEIAVAPQQAGRLWRLTVPGFAAGGFEMDPQIPPVYATERSRWFMP